MNNTFISKDNRYNLTIKNISYDGYYYHCNINFKRIDDNKIVYPLTPLFYSLFGVLNNLKLYLNDSDYEYMYNRIVHTDEFLSSDIRSRYLHDCLK